MRTSIQVSSTFLRLLYVAGGAFARSACKQAKSLFAASCSSGVADDLDLHAARAIIADLVHRAVHERVAFTQLDSSRV